MNQIINQLQNRKSVRVFTGESVKDSDLLEIIKSSQQAPTSVNGEQISLVVTRDKEKIKKIAEICGGQPQVESADIFITIVVDFSRATYAMSKHNVKNVIPGSAEGILVGAVDAGIMLNALQIASESLGYGTTAIGGIRNNPEEMIKILGLPKETYPIVGTTIGVEDKSKCSRVKPRVPVESFAHYEKYDELAVKKGVDEYEITLKKWWDEIGLHDMGTYSQDVSKYYRTIYFPRIAKTLREQGFDFKDEIVR